MGVGVLYALAAGLLWGLVFVAPLMLTDYPAALQSVGRYLAFGLLCLPLAWPDRQALRGLSRADWWEALRLAAVGNLLYYLLLASSIQRTGGPLTTMLIGTLPVVIALVANRRNAKRDGRLPMRRLAPSLLIIALGIGLVNHSEWTQLQAQGSMDVYNYALGVVLGLGAVACWTWYPLRNADWLRAHPERQPRVWATAQGLATLPLALLGFGLVQAWLAFEDPGFAWPGGPRPLFFAGLMLAMGLLASWLGTLCWNEASQRVPTHVAGQLIVFETLAALAYAFVWRGTWPNAITGLGIGLLTLGVWLAVSSKASAP